MKDKKKYTSFSSTGMGDSIVIPEAYRSYRIISTVYVPAGYPPVRLKNKPSHEDIIKWADDVRMHFIINGNQWIMNHALCYYLTYDFDSFEGQYKKICRVIVGLPDIKVQ